VILPCTPPTSDHPTVPTVGAVTALTCSTLSLLGLTSGCPTPTLMDPNPPTSSPPTPLHYYSTDLGTTGTNGGLLLQKTGNALGIPSDCSGGAWTNNLINTQSHMWVTNALTSPMTLTGDGNLSIWTYTNLAATASVSFCVEMYDMPSEGPLHQLVDILIPGYQPVAIGGAAYIPAVNPSTSGNWPTTPTQVTFPFRFLALNTNATSSCTTAVSSSAPACTVPIGDRIGFRIWVKVSQPVLVDFIYDTTSYPAALQLNSQ